MIMKKSFDPKKTMPVQFPKSIPDDWVPGAINCFSGMLPKNPFEVHGGLGKITTKTVLTKEGFF